MRLAGRAEAIHPSWDFRIVSVVVDDDEHGGGRAFHAEKAVEQPRQLCGTLECADADGDAEFARGFAFSHGGAVGYGGSLAQIRHRALLARFRRHCPAFTPAMACDLRAKKNPSAQITPETASRCGGHLRLRFFPQ